MVTVVSKELFNVIHILGGGGGGFFFQWKELNSSEAQWGMAEKEAKDFFREEWVEEPSITML